MTKTLKMPNTTPKRFLFSVLMTAKGVLVYSVEGPDQATALASLKAGDKNSKLVYDEINIQSTEEPVYGGPDFGGPQRRPNV
jgi:hypothetical protein